MFCCCKHLTLLFVSTICTPVAAFELTWTGLMFQAPLFNQRLDWKMPRKAKAKQYRPKSYWKQNQKDQDLPPDQEVFLSSSDQTSSKDEQPTEVNQVRVWTLYLIVKWSVVRPSACHILSMDMTYLLLISRVNVTEKLSHLESNLYTKILK